MMVILVVKGATAVTLGPWLLVDTWWALAVWAPLLEPCSLCNFGIMKDPEALSNGGVEDFDPWADCCCIALELR